MPPISGAEPVNRDQEELEQPGDNDDAESSCSLTSEEKAKLKKILKALTKGIDV